MQQQSAPIFLSHLFMYNVSLVPCNSFNSNPIFSYIYLPKLVLTEQFWSIIHTNTLLAEIWSQYKLWIFKIHCPSDISLFFFVRKFFALSREQGFSWIHNNNCWYQDCAIEYWLIGLFLRMNNFDWFIWIKH